MTDQPERGLRSAAPIRDPKALAAAGLAHLREARERREQARRSYWVVIAVAALVTAVVAHTAAVLLASLIALAAFYVAVVSFVAAVTTIWVEQHRQVDKRLRALELRQRIREESDRG